MMHSTIEHPPHAGRNRAASTCCCLALVLGCTLLPCPASAASTTGSVAMSGGSAADMDVGAGTTRRIDRTVEQDLTPGQAEDARAMFPATMDIDEEGFSGTIDLIDISLTPSYSSETSQVDRVRAFDDLPDNDVSRIPVAASFEVSSAAAPGAVETVELQRAEVSYEVTGTDADGVPDGYRATVVYRGSESALFVDGYHAVAAYGGEIAPSATTVAPIPAESMRPLRNMDGVGTGNASESIQESATMNPLSIFLHNGSAWVLMVCSGVLVASIGLAAVMGHGRRGKQGGPHHV